MIYKMSEQVWWGDKPSIEESMGKVGSIINVAHAIRKPYWQNVSKLDWDVWYFKLASPDREELSEEYMIALASVVDAIRIGDKFPLLCHCRMGGHRGPTAALFAYWHLSGRTRKAFNDGIQWMERRKVGSTRLNKHRVYRRCMFDFMKRKSDDTS